MKKKQIDNSIQLYEKAKNLIPGGVNSPVRAFKSVKGTPLFIKKGKGCIITDEDNNEYIDFVGSWGPLILGHANEKIIKALTDAAQNGTSFGAPTELEIRMAEKITSMVPSIEKVRMVNSGTEATMAAIRLARGYTNKSLIIKFNGCYHGHGDSFLIKAGSGALTLGIPDSAGITRQTASQTLVAEFNDIDHVKRLFEQHSNDIAAVIIEPVAGNMGVVAPKVEFLNSLRSLCSKYSSLLIFDEVMTGFRLSKGGAQERYNIIPDITTLGKIIGGGLPVGAYGGKKEIMDFLAPLGPVYQAGTLSGNPLAMASGLAMLDEICKPGFYERLEKKSAAIEDGLRKNIIETNTDAIINRVGSMITLFFTKKKEILNYTDAIECNTELFARYFHYNLDQGIYLAPSQFEAFFVSDAHEEEHIQKLIEINKKALIHLKNE